MTADEGAPSSPDDATRDTSPSTSSESTAERRQESPVPTDDPDRNSATTAGSVDGASDSCRELDTSGDTGVDSNAGVRGDEKPAPVPGGSEEPFHYKLWHAQSGPLFLLREVLTSAGAVVLVGLILFSVSGVWPPMVAVESGSMEPHMHKGDLVFITEPGRYTPAFAYGDTGVVTAEIGGQSDYRTFGDDGSVVVYDDPGRSGPPIIHRAEFYVEAGENWYSRANPAYISADDCGELANCPAPHAGFITKGDANGRYDQASGIAEPVKPAWITGVARIRIPYLGWVRLGLADLMAPQPGTVGSIGIRVDRAVNVDSQDTMAGVSPPETKGSAASTAERPAESVTSPATVGRATVL